MAERVAVMRVAEYDEGLVGAKLAEGLAAAGLDLPRGARVLIKPNVVSQNRPRQCTTTHPAVVAAICCLLADNHCRIVIGESSAFYETGYTRRGFETTGIAAVARRFGAELVAFEEEGGRLVPCPGGDLPAYLLATRLEAVDWVVSAAKLKTHAFAGLSATVKNLYGCVPGGAKFEYHHRGPNTRAKFARQIADIQGLIRPNLSVLDAIVGLEGNGPSALGRPRPCGILMAGANPWAVDFLAARMIGADPYAWELMRAGLDRGCLPDPESIVLAGDCAVLPAVPFRPAPVAGPQPREKDLVYRLVGFRPEIRGRRCDGCGACREACPLGAIGAGRPPAIDPALCLHCYHCVYRCPRRAIRLRGLTPWNGAAMVLRRLIGL